MPGPLTNFRPQTRTGRVNVTRDAHDLVLESRWGKWKTPVRLTPCDPHDPAFFAIQSAGADPAYVSFVREPDGKISALRLDDLVFMQKRPDSV
jgi:hypothetical protein